MDGLGVVEAIVLDTRLNGLMAYGSDRAAGIDMRACSVTHAGETRTLVEGENFKLYPNEQVRVGSGIKMHIGSMIEADDKEFLMLAGMLLPRSGIGTNNRIRLSNTVGLIDDDYQGEIIMVLENNGSEVFEIKALDRLAQLVIVPVVQVGINVVQQFSSTTKRGEGGFGSTGKQ